MSASKAMAQELARVALAKMRGGPLLAVSPARSEEILVSAFEQLIATAVDAAREARIEEREACADIADEEANCPGGDSASAAAERIRARGSK